MKCIYSGTEGALELLERFGNRSLMLSCGRYERGRARLGKRPTFSVLECGIQHKNVNSCGARWAGK